MLVAVFPLSVFAAQAANREPVGHVSATASAMQWTPDAATTGVSYVLVIATPDGNRIERTFASNPALKVGDIPNAVDGTYMYELRAVANIAPGVRKALANARRRNDDAEIARIQKEAGIGEPTVQAGAFSIKGGAFVTGDKEEQGPATPVGVSSKGNATTSVVHNPTAEYVVVADDESIQGSLCVGFDCVSGESFGFDTLRLKENNLRIKFDDTSTSAGFPNNDWQLTANDSGSGGANKFSIDDVTGAKTPFTITAGAPTNSLFVASSGKVGFGNSSPGLNLHITTTDTPAIRMEQTNGGGFTAQTWDIGANEANFFVRDLTGGSRLPFRVRPGAPTSSVDIAASGNVGIGTASPAYPLDVRNANAQLIAWQRNSGSVSNIFALDADSSGTYIFNASTSAFPFTILNDGKIGFGTTSPTNPIQHSNGAFLSSGGAWTNASSRALKFNINSLSAEDAICALEAMEPVTYNYKAAPDEHHAGFIAEDVPELVASKDRKGLSALDITAVLTKVVQEQQKTIDALSARIEQLEKSKN